MRIGFAGVWLRVVVAMLLGVSCGLPMAGQAVPTTNEVRAMRGLGPIEGPGIRDQGSGAEDQERGSDQGSENSEQ